MGADSNSSPRRFAFESLKILGVQDREGGGLRLTVEAVRPGPVNQFNVTEAFIDATLDRWPGQHVVATHDTQARLDVVHGEIMSAKKDEATKALIFEIDINATSPAMIENIRKGRAAVSIGASDPVLAVDPETAPAPWDVLDATPDHIMITRKGHQAQPGAQVLEVHASIGHALAGIYGTENVEAPHIDDEEEDEASHADEDTQGDKHDPEEDAEGSSESEADAEGAGDEDKEVDGGAHEDDEEDAEGALHEDEKDPEGDAEASDSPEIIAMRLAKLLPDQTAAIAAELLKLQGDAQDNQAMTKELEAQIKALEASNADLKAQVAEITKERDTLNGSLSEIQVAGFQTKVAAIEASLGKPKNELTDLSGKTVEEASAAYVSALEAFQASPPKVKDRVPTKAPIQATTDGAAPKKMKTIFGMRDLHNGDNAGQEVAE